MRPDDHHEYDWSEHINIINAAANLYQRCSNYVNDCHRHDDSQVGIDIHVNDVRALRNACDVFLHEYDKLTEYQHDAQALHHDDDGSADDDNDDDHPPSSNYSDHRRASA